MTSPTPPVNLKNPLIAGVLAFLMPGAGHFYQRRFFKAFAFAIGIWGSWWTGMAMSDWKALQAPEMGKTKIASALKFGGQAGVGTPALWAIYQSKRYYSRDNASPTTIPGPQDYSFVGQVNFSQPSEQKSGEIVGTLSLAPAQGDFGPAITGRLAGTLNGEPVTLQLDQNVNLDQPVRSNRQIAVTASAVSENGQYLGEVHGQIPRSLINWFACPLDQQEEADWHRDRGKYQELAMVFVWVAGLLNLLVIWDAVEGPAYGYNEENEHEKAAPPSA